MAPTALVYRLVMLLVHYSLVVAAAAAEHVVDVFALFSADVVDVPAPLSVNPSLVVYAYAVSHLLSQNGGRYKKDMK